MNRREVQDLLGLKDESTLRKYEKEFNLEIEKNYKGHKIYSDEIINKLKTIVFLRKEGNGLSTITKKIQTDTNSIRISEVENLENKEKIKDVGYESYTIENHLLSKIDNKLNSILELSEKYSRATFEIGKLQAEKENLQEKIMLVSDSYTRNVENVQNNLEKSEQEKSDLKKKLEKLEMELQNEKSKPWYKKLFRS